MARGGEAERERMRACGALTTHSAHCVALLRGWRSFVWGALPWVALLRGWRSCVGELLRGWRSCVCAALNAFVRSSFPAYRSQQRVRSRFVALLARLSYTCVQWTYPGGSLGSNFVAFPATFAKSIIAVVMAVM